MASERELKAVERINLRNTINQWNANRLDLFELSEPNEDLEFHGVMRFYFQDADQKVVTKCIRVSSTATVTDVVGTLIEKFRPDIRMLSVPDYALYEIHENREERKLGPDEPGIRTDREGRFLFRRMDHKSRLPALKVESLRFGRKLSRREHKKKKNKEAVRGHYHSLDCIDSCQEVQRFNCEGSHPGFTRSISNPEAVMRRRRQQKLERKLQQFRQEGSPEAGGTLRIFGESLNRDVPYKTLLLSTTDSAAHVVREILAKYGLEQEEPQHYCLVQVLVPPPPGGCPQDPPTGLKEFILDDDDCPLAIERQHNRIKGTLSFHIRRRPADYQPRKRKKKAPSGGGTVPPDEGLPMLQEVLPGGGGAPGPCHPIPLHMTEVGSAPSGSQGLQLSGPGVLPRHCVIAHTEGVVTVTPSQPEAETYVDGARVFDTTLLQHGATVRFGRSHLFRFWQAPPPRAAAAPPPASPMGDSTHRPPTLDEDHRLCVALSLSFACLWHAYVLLVSVPLTTVSCLLAQLTNRTEWTGRASEPRSSKGDPILPAVLELWEEHEALFLDAVINQLDWLSVQFKLVPAYTLYMACRYRASTHFRPETSPSERAQRLTALATTVGARVRAAVEQQQGQGAGPLAFWLANASELLHFLRQDRHLSAYTLDAQDLLTEALQLAFRQLVAAQRRELAQALPRAFLSPPDNSAAGGLGRARGRAAGRAGEQHEPAAPVPGERGPDHPALLVAVPPRERRRLAHLVAWAEQQGLELAADCHLARLIQAAHLLQAPKAHPQHDLPPLADCLLQAQLPPAVHSSPACIFWPPVLLLLLLYRHTLRRCGTCWSTSSRWGPGTRWPQGLVEALVREARQGEDARLAQEGRPLQLAEEPQLALPFLLPEDGYSCETLRGVPPGLQEFLQPLCLAGLCRLTLASPPPWATGPSTCATRTCWGRPPRLVTLTLKKSPSGMGLSIVAARGSNQDRLGIYVKSVVRGGAADLDGRLQAGDQLLRVDGHSLVGVSQEKAAELMTRTGPVVQLEVAKQGAIHQGLASLLCQPSPLLLQRGGGRLSERDIPWPPGPRRAPAPAAQHPGQQELCPPSTVSAAWIGGSAAMEGGGPPHLSAGSSMTMPSRGYPPGPSYSAQPWVAAAALEPRLAAGGGSVPPRPEARPLSTLVRRREERDHHQAVITKPPASKPPAGMNCPVTPTCGDQQRPTPTTGRFPPYWCALGWSRIPRDVSQVASPSPWEREEKEMVETWSPLCFLCRRLQRLEEVRQMRDEELHELESLPSRSSRQEERLRALRLEREFERVHRSSPGGMTTRRSSGFDVGSPTPLQVCPQDEEEEDSGYTLQDIDAVAERTAGRLPGRLTPGVIGAQEVYRDTTGSASSASEPCSSPAGRPGPRSSLAARKYAHVCRETGEEHTPRDKMKISRAQREIETHPDGVPTPNR
ncbi:hypothetical protein HPB48_005955 [Haemaphysalis longicornis]|uniref:Afadin n=1 Tax=Haemaphysalis longicornis TaxID=44386 RepID=A0A9J6FM64_HAELO|nr:hypothetical protein HPB48_005955 [Haemaphysalis longicornis]